MLIDFVNLSDILSFTVSILSGLSLCDEIIREVDL